MSTQTEVQCPTMVGRGPATNGQDVELPLFYVDCEVEVQITLGFVYERISFLNTTGEFVDGMFMCPTSRGQATVCSCDITFAGKTFSTSVVDMDGDLKKNEALEMKKDGEKDAVGFGYDPNCFTMPFAKLPKMSEIIVEIRYVQDLSFDHMKGEYSLMVPMYFPKGSSQIYENKPFKDVVAYRVLLAPGTEDGNWACPTHQLNVTNVSPGPNNVGKIITLEGNGENVNSDFVISYSAWANKVTGSVLCENDGKGGGSFMAFLQPPALSIAKPLPRKMVFLIDVSYSMGGAVLNHAKSALLAAMADLQPHDHFALCAYDDKMRWYNTELQPATSSNVNAGKQWVNYLQTTGLTDILQPIQAGTKLLQRAFNVAHGGGGHGSGGGFGHHGSAGGFAPGSVSPTEGGAGSGNEIPYLVLITDGAVYSSQENEIITFANEASRGREKQIRISTFGIGPYCNRYFLSNLSEAGMGYTETCLDMASVEERMVNFLSKTKSPVLANIKLNTKSALYLYPEKIPDLTVGAPLVIYGSYDRDFPSVLSVSGDTAEGPITFDVSSSMAENAPIVKMVEKRRIESMIGDWYISKDQKKKQEIVNKSVAIGVPCVLTRTAAYENPTAVKVHKHPNHEAPHGWKTGTTDNSLPPKSSVHDRQHARKNNPGAAVAAVAGVVIVGTGIAAVMAFGNVGATGANLPAADGMVSFMSEGVSGLGNVAGSAWDAVASSDIFSQLGAGAGEAVSFLGDAGAAAGDAIPGAVGEVGTFCSDLCGPANCDGLPCSPCAGGFQSLGQIFDPCVDIGGNCIGAVSSCDIGGLCGSIGDCGGAMCGGAGQLVGLIGDGCGSVAGLCSGDICGGVASACGSVTECVGSCPIGECLGGAGECLGGAGECVGGLFECLGGILGALN